MDVFGSVDEALDFAIGKEQEASDFYTDLAGKMEKPWMAELFRDFAKEEQGHKAKLTAIKGDKSLAPAAKKVADLKIGDYLIDVEPEPNMDYQDALIVAMKSEKAAFRLYTDLAASTEDTTLQGTFQSLAQEEAKHKLRLELEYDEFVLKEN
ncbi:ferritin family protein [Thermodesulfobacteriota bacterium]